MKKRILAIMLCMTVTFSLGACGQNEDDVQSTEDSGSALSGVVEQPKIETLADYSDMSVVLSGDYEITDEDLEAYFMNALYNVNAGLVQVTDRDVVQEGDIVNTDYVGYLNDEAFDGGSATEQWIDVSNNCSINTSTGNSSGSYIDGFSDGLIGAVIGEETKSEVTFPESYDNEDLAGQQTVFAFTVNEIYTEVTPDSITDEFVAEHLADAYEVNTVEEFMQYLETELAYNYTINYLIENSSFEISDAYLQARLEDYQAYFEEIYCQGLELEDYLSLYGYTVEQMQTAWLSSLENQVQAELVFEGMMEQEGLTVDETAHAQYLEEIMSANGTYFPDAESIYKYTGVGNAEAGESYMKNQTAVRDNFIANYEK